MNAKLLKTILKIATSDTLLPPHLRPVFPEEIARETGASESEFLNGLIELKNLELVRFKFMGTNIVELTSAGVEAARAVTY